LRGSRCIKSMIYHRPRLLWLLACSENGGDAINTLRAVGF
jgi:hypothetical protein